MFLVDAIGVGHLDDSEIGHHSFPLDHDRMAWDIQGTFPLDVQ